MSARRSTIPDMSFGNAAPRADRIGEGPFPARGENPDGQRDAPETAGCDDIFIDPAGTGDGSRRGRLGR
jgi:hypothetical protein